MTKNEEPQAPPKQDLEWEPVPLGVHLTFVIEKAADEYAKATEEMIRRWKKTG